MPSIVGAQAWVDVPLPVKKPYGVLDVVRVLDPADPHVLLGAEYTTDACFRIDEWLSNCMTPSAVETRCHPAVVGGAPVKTFHGHSRVIGDPFTLYDGVECDGLADMAEAERRARASLDLKESIGVENHLTSLLAAEASATDTVTDVVEAITEAEKWLDGYYGGVGVIMLPRPVAVRGVAADVLSVVDGQMVTAVGTPVALGVGGTDTVFAMGQVTILRGPVMSRHVPETVFATETGTDCRPARAIAERTYVALIECGVVAFQITG